MSPKKRKVEAPRPPAQSPTGKSPTTALLVGLLLLLGAGAGLYFRGSFVTPTIRRAPGMNVLLITIDTLRVDALGAYGNAFVETPWIDRLAREGVRFKNCHAQNVVTFPSHTNILSGRYPTEHGVHDNSNFRFPEGIDSIATLLKARGYRTGAFVSAFPLDARFGLARGFDVYDDRVADPESTHVFKMEERKGTETVAAALKWLGSTPGERSFAFVHLYEPHWPYEPPEPFATRFKERPYYGEVSAADAALRPLLEPLLDKAKDGQTLVVLTADHGESLGEHGEMTHGIFAYESTLHVPLILYAPRILPPRVVDAPARHVDILPTVLDALGLKAPPSLPGESLLPFALGGGGKEETSYFEALSASMNRGWAPLRGVLRGERKYIDLPVPEIYDLVADPGEVHNLAGSEPQSLDAFRNALATLRSGESKARRVVESEDVRERLRALGYVTSASSAEKTTYTAEDDPKNLIAADAQIQDILNRYSKGDLQGAIALGEEIVGRYPRLTLAMSHLAFLYREAGDLPAATATLRRAVAQDPESIDIVALLGSYLVEAGRPQEALRLVEPYALRPDPDLDVLVAQGMALANLSRPEEALRAFERCRSLEPGSGMPLVNIGTVHLMGGDREEAARSFREAIALEPSLARAHMNLGVVFAQTGKTDEAIAEWKQAIALEPNGFEALFDLGTLLMRLGRPQEARPFLERYVASAPKATEGRDIARVRAWLQHQPGSKGA